MTKKTDDDDDLALWREVTRTVKPVKARKAVPAKSAPVKSAPVKSTPAKQAAAAPPLKPRPPANGLDSGTARRIARGHIAPEAKIDLHGLSRAAAHDALVRFLRRAKRDGLRTVLVVTGKGKGPEGGIIRRLLPEWLAEGELAGSTAALLPARREDGGTGAFYLRLRKP